MFNWKDIGIRAAKTFIQAFIPVLITAIGTIDITDISASKSVIYSALISAAAAGISAVWNVISNAISNKTTTETEEDEQTSTMEQIDP